MIEDYLSAEDVTFDISGNDKFEIIEKLLAFLHERGRISDLPGAIRAVETRERVRATGLEKGVAIPHAKLDEDIRIVAGIARLKEPVDFQAVDGAPCRHIVMILAKKVPGGVVHISALRTFARVYVVAERMAQLDIARTPEEYFALLQEADHA
jgi:mannitol/fructose-specific phosphotransferase system IIA component (Ntr-type)